MAAPNPIEAQKYLRGIDYPASTEQLIERATSDGAPDEVRGALQALGEDEFDSPTAVSRALADLAH